MDQRRAPNGQAGVVVDRVGARQRRAGECVRAAQRSGASVSLLFASNRRFQHYELAMKRVRTLLELDFEAESEKKPNSCHSVMWAVFEAFNK